jgi:ankyrin repeat protein
MSYNISILELVKSSNINQIKVVLNENPYFDKEILINEIDNDGYNSLHYSSKNDDIEMLKLLLTITSSISNYIQIKTNNGNTAIHICSIENSFKVISYLLELSFIYIPTLIDNINNYGETAM